jgi:hypothetical protein
MTLKKRTLLALLAATALGGCVGAMSSIETRHNTAAGIAGPAGMSERIIPAGVFNLTTWSRIGKPGAPADLYI